MKHTKSYSIGSIYEGYGEISGISFKLLSRKGDICLFQRSDDYYEIITLKQQKETSAKFQGVEVIFEEKEVYPYGNAWDGKCVKSRKRAEKIFEQLTKNL